MNKICSKCQLPKTEDDFYTDSRNRDGLQSACKGCCKQASKTSYKKKPQDYIKKTRQYQQLHKEKVKENVNKWKQENKEHIKEYNTKYYPMYRNKNRNSINKYKSTYANKRRKEDLNFRLSLNIRSTVNKSLKGKRSPCSISKTHGCSDLAAYIRTTYLPGMTDDNYGNNEGQWSVDHIKPLALFDLTILDQLLQANHYTNLRALWHVDNMKKGSKFD